MLEKTDKLIKTLLIAMIASLFLFGAINFEKKDVQAAEGDAIAVRVMSNPNHYSPLVWYQSQKFSGNPTALKVDGYDAIQDGRTVYVNVANVGPGICKHLPEQTGKECFNDSECTQRIPDMELSESMQCESRHIYTNIYLISYNQDAKPETITIFNNIISKWKFNTNLTDTGTCFNQPKKCQGTNIVCSTDGDCTNSDNALCVNEACFSDKDCSGGGFCSSLKAKITRDTNRLADMIGLKMQLENYSKRNYHFPLLSSGTYVTGKTISTWPSWNGEFAAELGVAQPIDPINKLGDCGGIQGQYDPVTCWDNKTKSFSGSFSPDLNVALPSPDKSRVYVYSTDAKGHDYKACAVMESGLFVGTSTNPYVCPGSYSSVPKPVITCGSLIGIQGQPFSGFISVADPQNNPTFFHIDYLPFGTNEYTTKSTADPHKIEIVANNPTARTLTALVTYISNSGPAVASCKINISANAFLVYPVADQQVLIAKPLLFSVYAASSKKDYKGMRFNFSSPSGGSNPVCDPAKITTTSDGRAKCDAIYASATTVSSKKITVTATNDAGDPFTSQEFNLSVYNNPPVIQSINCAKQVRVGTAYPSCKISATDPDGHLINYYRASSSPAGIILNPLTGVFSGTPTASGTFDILFTARDMWGAVSAPPTKFTLQVNTYCGDKSKQSPNMEGKGGPSDNGYEACDNLSGTPKPWESSVQWQYGCNNLSCTTLKDGWCGDSILHNGQNGTKPYLEQCEPSTHTTPLPPLSSITHQYSCGAQGVSLKACQEIDGYCGDNSIQNTFSEQCEPTTYVKPTPAQSSASHQYFCGAATTPEACKITGGYCKDGKLQNTFGEQCDFGNVVKSCCSACKWTTGPTTLVSINGDAVLGNNESMNLNVPLCRGVTGGTFSATPKPSPIGPAIVFITDISGSMFDPTYAAAKQTMLSGVQRLYDEAVSNDMNIHVGTITTYSNKVDKIVPINNLGDANGKVQKNLLDASINTYASMGDSPDFTGSYKEAAKMLNDYKDVETDGKYIIILTDGYPTSATATTTAKTAKDSGIKIYTIAISNWDDKWQTNTNATSKSLRGLCWSSSDNGVKANCFLDNYSRRKPTASTDPDIVKAEMKTIYDAILGKILSRMPTDIKYYTVNGAPYKLVTNGLATVTNLPFTLPNTTCDISGKTPCNPSNFSLTTTFTGSGRVRYSDFKLNILPLCQ